MTNRRFYVVIKNRRRYFPTLETATSFANYVFKRYNVVLGIMEVR